MMVITDHHRRVLEAVQVCRPRILESALLKHLVGFAGHSSVGPKESGSTRGGLDRSL
jgi:hypothetical protein